MALIDNNNREVDSVYISQSHVQKGRVKSDKNGEKRRRRCRWETGMMMCMCVRIKCQTTIPIISFQTIDFPVPKQRN